VGQIYVVNADGTGLRQITTGPWSHAQPSWSPDGSRIFAYGLQETAEYEFGDIVAIEFRD
jgi:Tol biopolymer transport system component